MARSTGKSSRRGAPAPAAAAPVLEEVEGSGMGIEGAIVISTFLFLAGAIVLVLIASQRYAA